MTPPDKVILHFECCECGSKREWLLSETTTLHGMICNDCNKTENYLEIKGVTINHLPVKTPSRYDPKPPDSLEGLSNLITKRLKQWDCFDVNVSSERLSAFKRVIVARGLEWANMEGGDEPFVYDGIATLVVGERGADFEDHERRR